MSTQTVLLDGKAYVIVPQDEYEILSKAARLPPLPQPDEQGNYPATAYARAVIARSIVRDRINAGLSQKELARIAGIRVETLCRIETGKVTPAPGSVAKIDHALQQAQVRTSSRPRRRQQPRAAT